MTDEPMRETWLYSDDVRLITNLIKDQWSIGYDNPLNIDYEPEQFWVQGRIGNVFVYHISRDNRISTVDYRTLQRTSRIGIRVANRFRKNHFQWCDEVYRILMANRRLGKGRGNLCTYTYLEVTGDRSFNDLSGWYVTTFDVNLISYNTPLMTAGMGDEINKAVNDSTGSD